MTRAPTKPQADTKPPEPDRATGELRRLTIFLADLDGGGAERMMVAIANGLAARGVAVELVLARATGPYLKELAETVELTDLGTGSVTKSLLPLARHLRRRRPALLLSTLAHSSVVAIAAGKLAMTGLPVVIREANTPTAGATDWSSWKSNLAHRLMRWAYRSADGVIAVSDGVASALQSVLGVPGEKIATLYNPVVSRELRTLAAQEPDHPWLAAPAKPLVLGVGSLTPRKDFATLIEAFNLLTEDDDLRLVILGEGPERASLQRRIDELGLGARVDLAGFEPNPFSYMSRAAVYVLSSNLEGLPGSLVQALACGCPAVATDCPSGPYEILQGGKIGPLVPIGDAAAMATAIRATLQDPPDRGLLEASVVKYGADKVLDATYEYLGRVATSQRRHR